MSYHLVVRPEVYDDLLDAQTKYDQKEPGLGLRFLRAARQKMAHLSKNPLLYRIRHRRKKVRWTYPRPFPYRIIFQVIGTTLAITKLSLQRAYSVDCRGETKMVLRLQHNGGHRGVDQYLGPDEASVPVRVDPRGRKDDPALNAVPPAAPPVGSGLEWRQ